MLPKLRYNLPARDLDEELVDEWSFKLRSRLVQEGIDGVPEETADLYRDALDSDRDGETAAYNLGISAAKTYEKINIEEKKWRQSIRDGLTASQVPSDLNLRKARELLEYGFDDRDSLVDEGYEV